MWIVSYVYYITTNLFTKKNHPNNIQYALLKSFYENIFLNYDCSSGNPADCSCYLRTPVLETPLPSSPLRLPGTCKIKNHSTYCYQRSTVQYPMYIISRWKYPDDACALLYKLRSLGGDYLEVAKLQPDLRTATAAGLQCLLLPGLRIHCHQDG